MIGFLIKSIGVYKDGKGVMDNPGEGVGDIAYDFLKPFILLGTSGTWVASIVGFLGGYALGDGMVFKVVFWCGVGLFVSIRFFAWIIRIVLRKTAQSVITTGESVIRTVKK